jgi:hypothetical protein
MNIKRNVKRLKRRLLKRLDFVNGGIAVCAILFSFFVARMGSALPVKPSDDPKVDNIVLSVERVADAFELYNSKRFVH